MKIPNRTDVILNYKCNNNCRFCYAATFRRYNKFRGFDEIKKEIQESFRNGIRLINFNGGEPTIHPKIIEIIKFAKETGFENIQIITNGRMFSYEDFTKRILDAGLNILMFSIHGHKPQIHDYLTRVPESFKQSTQGIKNINKLKNQGYKITIMSNTTITKINYKYLTQIAKLLTGIGVNQLQFTFVDPIGSAWGNREDMIPKISEVEEYLYRALKVNMPNTSSEGIPFCFMKGFEKNVGELYMPDYWEMRAPDKENRSFDFRKKKINKVKGKVCKKCKFYNVCEGIWENYAKIYGFNEFKPIFGTKIKNFDNLK